MDESQTRNSDGTTSNNRPTPSYFRIFISPRQFWAAYGYWFCVLYYGLLHQNSDFVGPRIPFWEPLCPFNWGCGNTVDLFFFTIPVFFIAMIATAARMGYKKDKRVLRCAIVHILLMLLLTDGVSDIVNGFVWAMR